jgi:hypothetical protein
MMYFVKSLPTPEEFRALLDGSARVDPEWPTIVRLSYQAGIKSSVSRHLGPDHLFGEWVKLNPQRSNCTLKRRLPAEVLQHLASLPKTSLYFCPRLHAMSGNQFHNEWRKVCKEANYSIQLVALPWHYRDTHRAELRWERAQGYLDALAEKWLSGPEIEKLRADAKGWALRPPKSGNRSRRRTRAQLVVPLR